MEEFVEGLRIGVGPLLAACPPLVGKEGACAATGVNKFDTLGTEINCGC